MLNRYLQSVHSMANMGSYLPIDDLLRLNLVSRTFYDFTVPSIFLTQDMRANLEFKESTILDDFQKKQMLGALKEKKKQKLLYRASVDGYKYSTFMEKCENKGPTLCIMKTKKGIVFGAYTDIAWKRHGHGTKGNGNSFCFKFPDEQVEKAFFEKYVHDVYPEFSKDIKVYPWTNCTEVWHEPNYIFCMNYPYIDENGTCVAYLSYFYGNEYQNYYKGGDPHSIILCGETDPVLDEVEIYELS